MKNWNSVLLILLDLVLISIVVLLVIDINKETIHSSTYVSFSNVKPHPYPDRVNTLQGYTLRGQYLTYVNKDRKQYNLPMINLIEVDTIHGIKYLYYHTHHRNDLSRNYIVGEECEVQF